MPFDCSFNIGTETGDAEVGHCNLFLWNFSEHSWKTNSHFFLRELIFCCDKMSSQQFSFPNYFG